MAAGTATRAHRSYDLTASFARDDQGSLRLTPFPPSDPGDAFWCFSQVWTNIG
jgi:hypothetical protein